MIKNKGFTIVELLIVIVVIGILAGITIIAYNGIQNRSKVAVIQNNISQSIRKIEAAKVASTTESYPSTQTEAALQASGGVTLNYYYEPGTNKYCIEGISGTITYSSVGRGSPTNEGRCNVNGLVGWWPMNNDANDQSGNGFNGITTSIVGSVGQNGIANSALEFNGSTSRIAASNSTDLHPDNLTISVWIKPIAWNTGSASSFVAKRGTNSGYFFEFLTSSGTVNIDLGGSSTRWNTQYVPPFNQWRHLLFTASPAGRSFYVNGSLFRETTTVPSVFASNTASLSIGHDDGIYNFNGSIDDVRIYNRVLSAGEAALLFSQGAQ